DSCSARAGEAASSARRTVQATLPELMRKEVGEKLDRLIELYEREHPRMAIDLSSQGESLRNAWKVTVRKRHDSTGSRS
ncbi:hypothetical protein ABE10_02635, partial [Bacillus toyonensis]|nr:hypothetical protein [Bacillus toyonensis]